MRYNLKYQIHLEHITHAKLSFTSLTQNAVFTYHNNCRFLLLYVHTLILIDYVCTITHLQVNFMYDMT